MSAHLGAVKGDRSIIGSLLQIIQSENTDLWEEICRNARPSSVEMAAWAVHLSGYQIGRTYRPEMVREPFHFGRGGGWAISGIVTQINNYSGDWVNDFRTYLKLGTSPGVKEEREVLRHEASLEDVRREKEREELEKKRKKEAAERRAKEEVEAEAQLVAIVSAAETQERLRQQGGDW